MKTEQCYLYSSPSGINLIEGDKMPVKPEFKGDYFLHYGPQKQYEAALEAAKESAIHIQDQEMAAAMIRDQYRFVGYIRLDYIYGPFSVEYHKEITCNRDCPGSCFHPSNCDTKTRTEIAILLPEKEPQEDGLKEKIEFIKGAFQCYAGFPGTEGLLRFLKESKFTITRKR